jgi:hypothetical protein
MNPSARRNVARAAGALVGLALALGLLLVSRPVAAGTPAPASVRVTVEPAGELEIAPAPPRPVLEARGLAPGGRPASGGFAVRNQTGADLALALLAEPDSTALDGLLQVRVRAGDRLLAESTLEGLRLRPVRLRLASGERARVRLEAWLPDRVLNGYEGIHVDVALVPLPRPIGGAA